MEQKDLNCLGIKLSLWEDEMNSWARYFCINHKNKSDKRFKTYCNDVINYLCDNNRIVERDLQCASEPKPHENLVFSNLQEKSAAEGILWKELESCFSLKPELTRFEKFENDRFVSEPDENFFASCVVVKKKDNWNLESVNFRIDEQGTEHVSLEFGTE